LISLQFVNGNVLDIAADAILLTVDGMAKGMEGNIARAFARRWPDIWDKVKEEIPYPLPYGSVFDYEPDDPDCPFKLVLIASLLPHREVTAPAQKGFIRSSFDAVLRCALHDYRLASLAAPLLKCGWRLSAQEELLAMIDAVDAPGVKGLSGVVSIATLDAAEYDQLNPIIKSMGFHTDVTQAAKFDRIQEKGT